MNSDEFDKLYELYYPWVRSIAYRMVGATHFQDLAQESFLKVWKFRKSFDGRSNVKTWIYRIAVNCILDFFRTQNLERHVILYENIDSLTKSDSTEVHLLHQKLRELDVEDRLLISLHYFEGLSLVEIASVMKTFEGTIKSRLYNAREKLRTLMEGGAHERKIQSSR